MNAPTVPTNNEEAEALALIEEIGNHVASEYDDDPNLDRMILQLRALAARRLPVSGDNAEARKRETGETVYEVSDMSGILRLRGDGGITRAEAEPREAAPSDSDRELKAERLRQLAASYRMDLKSPSTAAMLDDAADTLSRTSHPVQVEPTVEEWNAAVAAERASHPDRGYTAEHDRAHGLRHLANWAIDYARRGKGVKSSSMILALLDAAHPVQVEVTADDMVQKVARVIERETDEPGWSAVVIARNVLAALGGGK